MPAMLKEFCHFRIRVMSGEVYNNSSALEHGTGSFWHSREFLKEFFCAHFSLYQTLSLSLSLSLSLAIVSFEGFVLYSNSV
jgi:hypothetical protein